MSDQIRIKVRKLANHIEWDLIAPLQESSELRVRRAFWKACNFMGGYPAVDWKRLGREGIAYELES